MPLSASVCLSLPLSAFLCPYLPFSALLDRHYTGAGCGGHNLGSGAGPQFPRGAARGGGGNTNLGSTPS